MVREYNFIHTMLWHSIAGGTRITPSLGGIILGHFSLDGTVKEEHFNFKNTLDTIVIDEHCSTDMPVPTSLYREIISKFSFTGHTVVEAMATGMEKRERERERERRKTNSIN